MSKIVEETLLKQLKNPFDPRFVKWRIGATSQDKQTGIALAYVDSREVMKRLDDVCGVSGWQDRYIAVEGGFICEISIKIGDEWITRSNAAGNTRLEPIKGGASDAFKRAASTWGIGRYLYYLPNLWMPIKQAGNSYVLAEAPELPGWAQHKKDMERWEDVAELELSITATADQQEIADNLIANLDAIRAIKNKPDLEATIKTLSEEDQILLANEINIKRRELRHASEVNPDNS